MAKIFFVLSFIFLSLNLPAQIAPIDTDRPDQSESATLVPVNWLQFEAGLDMEQSERHAYEFFAPALLSKYGLSKRIELRLITTLETNSMLVIPTGTIYSTGLDAVEAGAKIALFNEKNLRPKTAFIFHFSLPAFSSAKFRPDKVAPNFRFTMQHTLSSLLSVAYNLGCEWDGFTNDPAYIYTLTAGVNLSQKWYSYVEGFGNFKRKSFPENNIDGGIAYTISADTKVDLSSGLGLSEAATNWYVAIGFSLRFRLKK